MTSSTSLFCLVFSNQKSKTQIYPIHKDRNTTKAGNPHNEGAGTRECRLKRSIDYTKNCVYWFFGGSIVSSLAASLQAVLMWRQRFRYKHAAEASYVDLFFSLCRWRLLGGQRSGLDGSTLPPAFWRLPWQRFCPQWASVPWKRAPAPRRLRFLLLLHLR